MKPDSVGTLPRHVAIIMDGNGRWAQKRGLPRLAGHRAGTENIRRAIETFASCHIPFLTLYAFSTENWNRPNEEVAGLMQILKEVLEKELESLREQGVRLKHLGKLDGLSEELSTQIERALERTKDNRRITVNVAFNYGGRDEILNAVRRIIQHQVPGDKLDEATFARYLYTAGIPDPDLIIRTADEQRLSNFLLWQAAYSEYYYTKTLWPDFGPEEIQAALLSYSQRTRRFGGIEPPEFDA